MSLSIAFPDKNSGAGCHFLLQVIFLTQGSNLYLFCLLHCRWILYPMGHRGSPVCYDPFTLPFSKYSSRNSLVVQWLKLCTDTAGRHRFKELRSYRLYCVVKKTKQNEYISWSSQSDLSETSVWLCCHIAHISPQCVAMRKIQIFFFK